MLNEQQLAAVTADDSRPILVIAGPGAGKTLVLTLRIAWLIEKGVKPEGILATTFTRKAADEMKQRLVGIVGQKAVDALIVNTIHGVCYGMLREEGLVASVIEAREQQQLLEDILGRNGIRWDVGWQYPLYWIRQAKMALVKPNGSQEWFHQTLLEARADRWQAMDFSLKLEQCYRRYEGAKKSLGLIDFDDMVMEVALRLREDANFCRRWQGRVSHVLLDEAQDTTRVSFEILRALSEPELRFFAVGDPRQSLYRWANADPDQVIYGFRRLLPKAIVLPLEVNYRSTRRIVEATNRVMEGLFDSEERAEYRTAVIPHPGAAEGAAIEVRHFPDVDEEAAWVAEVIRNEMANGLRPKDFFVLYRLNAQSRAVEDALAEAKIPYVVQGSPGFWERKVVRDILAYLALVHDPSDNDAFRQVANIASAEHPTFYRGFGMRFFTDCRAASPVLWEGMLRIQDRLDDFQRMGVRDLVRLVERVRAESAGDPALAVGLIRSLCYDAWLRRKEGIPEDADVAGQEGFEDLEELQAAVARFRSIPEVLEHVERMRHLARERQKGTNLDAVVLSTIHRCKGLQRRAVIGIGLSECILPHWRSDSELEMMWRQGKVARDELPVLHRSSVYDERCAAFVLVSRAQELLCLSTVGEYRGRRLNPSRFLAEASSGIFVREVRKTP